MNNCAVFLDRDGVINREPPHYAHLIEHLDILPGVAAAIRRLNQAGLLVIIVSNQSGVARGYFTEADVALFNSAMLSSLRKNQAEIDAVYYCPHHPEATVAEYRVNCQCRKPATGMLDRAAAEHEIDLAGSYMVGDKETDIDAGKAAGCRTVLVTGGQTGQELPAGEPQCDYLARDLYEAADIILSVMRKQD